MKVIVKQTLILTDDFFFLKDLLSTLIYIKRKAWLSPASSILHVYFLHRERVATTQSCEAQSNSAEPYPWLNLPSAGQTPPGTEIRPLL